MSEWNENKRSGEFQPMKDVVDKLMRAYQLTGKMAELDVLNKWEEMMGKAVAFRTTKLSIKNKVLYIELNSSVMRDELLHGKQIIIERVNQQAGFRIIEDVWFG
jgi:predicted nucleic acid-binding Zn ribbon protein